MLCTSIPTFWEKWWRSMFKKLWLQANDRLHHLCIHCKSYLLFFSCKCSLCDYKFNVSYVQPHIVFLSYFGVVVYLNWSIWLLFLASTLELMSSCLGVTSMASAEIIKAFWLPLYLNYILTEYIRMPPWKCNSRACFDADTSAAKSKTLLRLII